jgi:hypothetical protein
VVTFKFKQPLPEKLTLAVHGGAFGPNIGKVFKIMIGPEVQETVYASDPFNRPETHRMAFKPGTPTDTIQITVPEPSQPANGDPRKLGLGLISVKIEN